VGQGVNILLDKLPEGVEIGGVFYEADTDFRVMARFEMRALEESEDDGWVMEALAGFYKVVPEDVNAAFLEMVRFYRMYEDEPEGQGREVSGDNKILYSFEHDAKRIYAAFYQQYGLDLCGVKLHWFKFRSLFMSLAEDTELVKIMSYRAMDLSKIKDRDMKEYYRALKKQFALPVSKSEKEKLRAIEEALEGDGNLDGIM